MFVTQEDMGRLAGRVLQSEDEVRSCFEQWYWRVDSSRRMGSHARPSVVVDVEGVAIPERL